ncbi:MAG: hypothetical protein DSY91_05315 [Deltaproteobacteria bacterium]|nr:MAG: hypothetical protein DSY91_05315 [Deltaproteobacteria bacterium]
MIAMDTAKSKVPRWFSLDQLVLFFKLFRDPEVSWVLKLIPIFALVYLISPYDLIPDFLFPGIGEIDDIVVLVFAVSLFNRLAPVDRIKAHLQEMASGREKP